MGHYLILGGAGGIGQSITAMLTQAGHKVHIASRKEEKLKALADKTGASYSVCDVLDDSAVEQVVQDAAPEGLLDGLVYAVGTITLKPVSKITAEDVLADFKLNALGAFQAVQKALPCLKKADKTASVLLFSTVAMAQGFPSHASIAMAKGAVEGLVKSLAAELAPKIRVNAIAPSLTDTPLASAMTSSEQMVKAIGDMHALRRIGQPDDMAGLARVLLSEEGSYITGQIIGVDGGRSTLLTKG
jgi:NAD(P)-dependent dehydrogenase (short-subunit alcohol dehydrogenase family)